METIIKHKLNKLIFVITNMYLILLTLIVFTNLFSNSIDIKEGIVRIAVYIIILLCASIVYKVKKNTNFFIYYMLVTDIVITLVALTSKVGIGSSGAIYCIFMLFLLYDDKAIRRVLFVGAGSAIILSIIVQVLVYKVDINSSSELYMVNIVLVIFFSYIYTQISKLSKEDNDIKIERIEAEKVAQENILNDILKVGASLEQNCSKVYDATNKVSNSSETINSVIEQVAEGANETAISIQSQLKMTKNIQEHIDYTKEDFSKMSRFVKETNDSCHNTNIAIMELSKKAENAEVISRNAQLTMNLLKQKSIEINQITTKIAAIAKQTNLLSLNASIESVRAGEYGKGFSVVAESIGKLASESQELTKNINVIVKELDEQADFTVAAVNSLSSVSEEQGELIQNVNQDFEIIYENMNQIVGSIDNINIKIDDIVVSNGAIVDSINDISAVSEESNASTQEVASMTITNRDLTDKVNESVHELLELSRYMLKYGAKS